MTVQEKVKTELAAAYNPSGLPKYVCEKRAKGKVYYYFDTGKRREGRRVLSPLPAPGQAGYTRELAKAQRARSSSEAVNQWRSL